MTITYRYTEHRSYFYRIEDQENEILESLNIQLKDYYSDKNLTPIKPVTLEELIEMISSDFTKGRSREDVYISNKYYNLNSNMHTIAENVIQDYRIGADDTEEWEEEYYDIENE